MGAGKTETALALAARFAAEAGFTGLFFGLPTQATADQMFERVVKFVGGRTDRPQVILAHGQARSSKLLQALLPS